MTSPQSRRTTVTCDSEGVIDMMRKQALANRRSVGNETLREWRSLSDGGMQGARSRDDFCGRAKEIHGGCDTDETVADYLDGRRVHSVPWL